MIGKVLVDNVPKEVNPAPYIPLFYQDCSGIKCPHEASVCVCCNFIELCDFYRTS